MLLVLFMLLLVLSPSNRIHSIHVLRRTRILHQFLLCKKSFRPSHKTNANQFVFKMTRSFKRLKIPFKFNFMVNIDNAFDDDVTFHLKCVYIWNFFSFFALFTSKWPSTLDRVAFRKFTDGDLIWERGRQNSI